ncbi:ADP-ribosylglycohydrolase family protein [Kaistia algarum]|uniref:ADP-ribosylglycohydrolase family protein n=1 Tax=Kaistia algarum TaxID=2083279 RepID=UPI000CE7D26D|nr:ADP-ribosylglycohydrolase family protein [Kaistia algarum]MCX5512497.1 ADP-ribosylglycohydrolase family protein [Kaistia algarum]PPE81966.1 ADP-ribosylglycohydrolase family protein [Kaistia algarum]
MKAWEFARDLLRNAEPVLRSEEEQTWDASEAIAGQDFWVRMFWQSNVPGSGAPESLAVAAVQSLENKGWVVPAENALWLEKGLAAVDEGDMEALHVAHSRLKAVLRQAKPDPEHPSQKTKRFSSFAEYEAAVSFPPDVAYDVEGKDFEDRIAAGWWGQIIGAAVGTALEGYTTEKLEKAFGRIDRYMRPPNTYNDDITFELAFLYAFALKGHAITSADVGDYWVSLIPVAWSAEAVALENLRRGVYPPESALDGNPFDEWIGAQMRGAIVGMVAPGRAREAARLAWLDAEVSHTGNGILGEVFNAVLVARAFVETDMRKLAAETVELMPADTEYGAVVRFALDAARKSADWKSAWALCDAEYVEYNWIHAYPNAAAQVIALWFGQGDFDETLAIIGGCGHDVDCNAAQMLAAVAIAKGFASIDKRWIDPIGDELVTYMRRPAKTTTSAVCAMTVDAVRSARS